MRRHQMRGSMLLLIAMIALSSCRREPQERSEGIPVTVEVAKRSTFRPAIALLGVVRPARSIPLVAVSGGIVRYPRRFESALQTGAQVARGELIAEIQNDDLLFEQSQARLQSEAAASDFERASRSFEQGIVSSAEHQAYRVRAQLAREAWQAAMRQAARLRIVAPEAGALVVSRPIAPGTEVPGGTVLAEVSAGGAPRIESAVAAAQRELLRPGLEAEVTAGAQPLATARITEVASVIDPNGTARVVASVTSGSVPPPGGGVELRVVLDERQEVLTVPEEAIVAGPDGPSVFVSALAQGSFRQFRVKRGPVKLGGRAGGRIEILDGIRDGDTVVISGADALTDGAVVTIAGDEK